MTRAVGYGIDFGTTNSSISIAYDNGDVDLVSFPGREEQPYSMPSLVFIDRNQQRTAGQNAIEEYLISGSTNSRCSECSLVSWNAERPWSDCRSFRLGHGCADSRLLAGLKSELASSSFQSTHSWAVDFDIEELIAIMLSALKKAADREAGEEIDRVILGHPVAFAGAMGDSFDVQQETALKRLVAAAKLAGFSDVALVPEPEAALVGEHLADGVSVAVDFGGGTFDVAVVEVDDGREEIVALQGAAIGGTNLDGALFDLKMASAIGLDQSLRKDGRDVFYPAAICHGLRTLPTARHLMNDPQLYFTLTNLERRGIGVQPVRSILHGGLAHSFYGEIERTKIELSIADASQIHFVRRGAIAVIEDVSRSEFAASIAPFVDAIGNQIDLALRQAGVVADDVVTVVRTGGSSLLPSFNSMLSAKFAKSDIRERPAFTSVAAGLGRIAAEKWAHVR